MQPGSGCVYNHKSVHIIDARSLQCVIDKTLFKHMSRQQTHAAVILQPGELQSTREKKCLQSELINRAVRLMVSLCVSGQTLNYS